MLVFFSVGVIAPSGSATLVAPIDAPSVCVNAPAPNESEILKGTFKPIYTNYFTLILCVRQEHFNLCQ